MSLLVVVLVVNADFAVALEVGSHDERLFCDSLKLTHLQSVVIMQT